MKTEMSNLQRNIKLIESTLGPDHLRLVVAARYVERLLQNERIVRYFEKHHSEIHEEFRKIVDRLEQPVATAQDGATLAI